MENLKKRYRYSIILLRQLVITDFKVRYQGSALGYVWTLLRPLALFAVLYVVFALVLGAGDQIPHYPVYLLLGIVLWNYFVEVTNGGVSAIVGSGDLIRKINFPKYVIILSGSFSALINLCINFIVIGIFMYINDVTLTNRIILLPLVIAQLFVFSLAVSFILGAAYVKLRDINYVWEVVLQAGFYLTPILYPIELVIEKANISVAKVMMLNPLAQMIQDARMLLISPETLTISDVWGTQVIRLVPYGITVGAIILASYYFRKQSKYFAEEV